jgi:hypothetical protein
MMILARKFAECEPSRIIPSVQGNDHRLQCRSASGAQKSQKMGKIYPKNSHFSQISEAKVPILAKNFAKYETSRIIPSVQGNDRHRADRCHWV